MGHHRLVLDCGMHPKETGEDALPNFKAIAGREIEAILVSHAHQDHIGTLPVLMRRLPTARVFMTEATAEIGNVLLHNSVNVMTRQREEIGPAVAGLYPLFTHRETDRASERWRWCPMRQRFTITGERAPKREKDALTFEFFDAGHVLGSSGILLRAEGQTVFYTGDVNFDDQTIMEAAVFPDEKIDVLIMECTRGDHENPLAGHALVKSDAWQMRSPQLLSAARACSYRSSRSEKRKRSWQCFTNSVVNPERFRESFLFISAVSARR